MFIFLSLWQRTRTKGISLLQAGYTHHDAACELKHGVSNYSPVAQNYRLANLLTDPLSCILCVPSLQTALSIIIIIKPLLFQQKLEHIEALGSETGDVRCAWRSLRTSATNVKQHRVLSKYCLSTVLVHNLKIFFKKANSRSAAQEQLKKVWRLSFSLLQQGQTN